MAFQYSPAVPQGETDMATLRTQADVFKLPLPAPPKGEAIYFDEGKPKDRAVGLALRIRRAGSRKFLFYYRHGGRLLRVTIGDASSWTLDAARTAARGYRVQVEKGENPALDKAAKRDASALIFSKVKDDFLSFRKPNMKPRSYEECERHLNKHWKPLHGLAVGSIDRATVAARLRVIAKGSGPVAADRARSTLSAFFAWCIGEGHCEANPVTGTNKHSEDKERERTLADAELAAIWLNAPVSDYGRIVRLLMLNGQRRDEMGSLRRSELQGEDDSALIALPGDRTKNKRPHDVPLSAPARDVLASCPEIAGRDLIFGEGKGGYSGWSRSKEALDKLCGVKDWTLHDLRRTVRTGMGALGIAPHIAEGVLNHLPPKLIRTYDKNKYLSEKRAALDIWASRILTVVAKAKGANVTRLKRA